jgi:arylsulfatase A-like enzyme
MDGVVLVAMAAVLVLAMRAGRPGMAAPMRREYSPWNFLIVVVDTLRYDVTSMAGEPNTPFLQHVAERGVSFSRAFSPHDSTPPSHFSIFTGLREGLGRANDRPDMSLSYQLRARGYRTFGVSANGNLSQKWMNSLSGFTQYTNLYDEWIAMTPDQRAAHLPAINARLRHYGARENDWNQGQLYASGDEVLTRLRAMLGSAEGPFFGFVNIIEPHDPYVPSAGALGNEPPAVRQVDPDLRFRAPRYPLADVAQISNPEARLQIRKRLESAQGRLWSLSDDLGPPEIETYKRRYAASVRDADDIIRSIFLELERHGMMARTWVVIVSDHGESFGEDGFMTHSLSDMGNPEASFHVPMVWAPPAMFTGSATIRDDVSLADIAPTIYDLAGIDWAPLKARASGEFGRSLIEDLSVAAQDPTASATMGAAVSDAERRRMREDALDRLRALGYIQ